MRAGAVITVVLGVVLAVVVLAALIRQGSPEKTATHDDRPDASAAERTTDQLHGHDPVGPAGPDVEGMHVVDAGEISPGEPVDPARRGPVHHDDD